MSAQLETAIQLTKQSMAIIREKKSLLILSCIRMIIVLGALSIALIPLYKIDAAAWETGHASGKELLIFFGILLLFFAFANLVTLFFSSALTYCTLKHIQHHPYTVWQSIKITLRSLGKLYYWQSIATSVGPAVRFSESWIERWQQTHFATQVLHRLKWVIAIFLIIPILVSEKIKPHHAIKRSAELISAKWGTPTIACVGMSGTAFLIRLILLIPALLAIVMGGKIIITIGTTITAILFFSFSAIYSTTIIMTVSALYLFANDINTAPYYDLNLLKCAFK